jgi:hypothetical protein
MHTFWNKDLEKGTKEFRDYMVFIIRANQLVDNEIQVNEASNFARENNCSLLIVTQRKKAKSGGEIGRIYVKGRGLSPNVAVNILCNQPRSGERNGWRPRKAIVVSQTE